MHKRKDTGGGERVRAKRPRSNHVNDAHRHLIREIFDRASDPERKDPHITPINALTCRPYVGIDALKLRIDMHRRALDHPVYATRRELADLGMRPSPSAAGVS
jgi:hypothetical protein